MNKIDFVNELAFSFGEEITIFRNGKKMMNVKLDNIFNYIDKLFDNEDNKIIDAFYRYVLENFRATTVEKFPCVATIKDLYYRFLDVKLLEENKYIPFTQQEAFNNYGNVNKVTYEPPPGMENVSLQDRLKDYETLNDNQMLKKYGIRLTFEVWSYINEKERTK